MKKIIFCLYFFISKVLNSSLVSLGLRANLVVVPDHLLSIVAEFTLIIGKRKVPFLVFPAHSDSCHPVYVLVQLTAYRAVLEVYAEPSAGSAYGNPGCYSCLEGQSCNHTSLL